MNARIMSTGRTLNLFADTAPEKTHEPLCPGAAVLRGFALANESALITGIQDVASVAPYRHLITPGGFRMSVAMTNCGAVGWVSDRRGYRYDPIDPHRGKPWPAMPVAFMNLARDAAAQAGFDNFQPDACLINRYAPGARLSMHQDRDEHDLRQPIVSVSLGIPAVFQFGGLQRADKPLRVPLLDGDVVVWGGPARLRFHGVMPLKEGHHDLLGAQRINLTFRKAS